MTNADDDEEEDGYCDENSVDVALVVETSAPKGWETGRQVGWQAGRQADSGSWGNSSSQWVSLPVSQHISTQQAWPTDRATGM